jgi:tRNA(Glu) U13 pseudouridine synthase TruD
MLRIYFEKFMSFLWNKASSNFLRRKIISKRKGFSLKTPYSYLFIPSKIRENIKEILTKDLFSVPGTSFPPCYPEFELYLKREFEKLSLSFPPHLPDFLEPDKFKGYKRTLWVNTSETQYSFEQDKLFLSFSLSPGSYATLFLKILIKRVSLSH